MISMRTIIAVLLSTMAVLLCGLGYVTWWQIHTATLQAQVQSRRSNGFAVIDTARRHVDRMDDLALQYVATGAAHDQQRFDALLVPGNGTQAPHGGSVQRGKAGGVRHLQLVPMAMVHTTHFSKAEQEAFNKMVQASKLLLRSQLRIMAAVKRPHNPDEVSAAYRLLTSSTYVAQKALVAKDLTRLRNLIDIRAHGRITALDARSKRLMRSQIVFFVLLLLLSGAMFVLAERGLTRPLRDLAKHARHIARGDYAQRIKPHDLRELQHVGDTFNDMAMAIQRDISRREQAEKQALEAQADAERANRVKSDFLANMSHEIRTPLHTVIGMTDLLRDTTLDNKQRNDLDVIRGSSTHLLAIINDILDFSKIEADMLVLDEQEFDLHAVVEDAIEMISVKAAEKNLDLMYEFDPGTPMRMIADASRVRQVLVNYLSNAVKFTEHGEVRVSVSSTLVDIEHQRLIISVHDSGIGIAPDQLDRLFKPFIQADASTTRHFGGTGLGLAICKRLAELMGGEVAVQSQPGAGSVFLFTFVANTRVAHPLAAWPGMDRLVGKSLLIVDGNATRRRILGNMALDWGLDVTRCDSSFAACHAAAHDEHFDLAMIDDPGPDVDVLELVRDLRKCQHRPGDARLPILLLGSVNGTALPVTEFEQVVRKPPRQKSLFEAMVQILAPGDRPVVNEPALRMPDLSALSILVVEDHPLNREIVLRLLGTLGLAADTADNGVSAVLAVERKPYDVVLMDVQMPAMDGLEATRRIRKLSLPRQPYIFAMTAGVLIRERQRCIAAGMNRHLPKPIRKQDLVQALQEIDGADLAGPPAPSPSPHVDAAIDAHAIGQLVNDLGRDGAADVLRAMVDTASTTCRSLDEASRAGDLDVLRRQVARMKANCLMIGCTLLVDTCTRVEKTLLDSAGANTEETCHDIVRRYTGVMRQLTPWLEYL